MISKIAVTLLIATSLAKEVFNSSTQQLAKRDVVVEWVTRYETVVYSPPHGKANIANAKDNSQATSFLPSGSGPTSAAISPSIATQEHDSVQGSPNFVNKRGLASNITVFANFFGQSCIKCSWAYNWDSDPHGSDPRFSFVPMLWSNAPEHLSQWETHAERAIASGSHALFSFNEPDNVFQANMPAQDAAAKHMLYMNKYGGQALIGAPSVTNSGVAGLCLLPFGFVTFGKRCLQESRKNSAFGINESEVASKHCQRLGCYTSALSTQLPATEPLYHRGIPPVTDAGTPTVYLHAPVRSMGFVDSLCQEIDARPDRMPCFSRVLADRLIRNGGVISGLSTTCGRRVAVVVWMSAFCSASSACAHGKKALYRTRLYCRLSLHRPWPMQC